MSWAEAGGAGRIKPSGKRAAASRKRSKNTPSLPADQVRRQRLADGGHGCAKAGRDSGDLELARAATAAAAVAAPGRDELGAHSAAVDLGLGEIDDARAPVGVGDDVD